MKIHTITQTVLTAEEGHYLTDGSTYGTVVVLPAAENAQNWHEIPKSAYDAMRKEQEENAYEEDISVPL